MKNLYRLGPALLLAGLSLSGARAQGVGLGTATPDASAALDIVSASKGLLVPRVADATALATPATGLLVFQTGAPAGFYYNAGTPATPAWQQLNAVGGPGDNLGNHTATTNLNLQGNALTGTGASIGTAVGLGVRADGGLNIGQNTAGSSVYLGYGAGQANTGPRNQFGGISSGYSNTSGSQNQFSGYQSGYSNVTGYNNQFSGFQSGFNNTTGSNNQFSGFQSGFNNTTGSNNQFSGFLSGLSNTTGSSNQFSGFSSGYSNTTGDVNQFSGYLSGYSNTSGSFNQFSGYSSGLSNTTGNFNQFSGYSSGRSNTTGGSNVFSGYESGDFNTTGGSNVFSGFGSGYRTTSGIGNVFIGYQGGLLNNTGSYNTALGHLAGPTTSALANATAIGNAAAVSQSNSLVLGGTGANAVKVGIGTGAPAERLHIYGPGVTVLRLHSSDGFGAAGVDFWSDPQGSASEWRPAFVRSTDAGGFTGGLAFYTNGSGSLTAAVEQMRVTNGGLAIGATALNGYRLYVAGQGGATGGFVTASDARLKTGVRPLTGALALVQALRGVRYEWNAAGVARGGAAGRPQVGVLAQELEAVLPELVSTGTDGYKAVNYAQLAPVLIEALKEQQAQIEALKAEAGAARAEATAATAQAAQATAATEAFGARLRRLEAAGEGQARR